MTCSAGGDFYGPVWLPALACIEACAMQFAHVWLPARGSYAGLCNAVCPCLVARRGSYAGLHSAQSRSNTGLASMPDLVIPSNADLHKLMRHTKMKYFNLPCLYRPLLEHGGDCMQHNVSNQT